MILITGITGLTGKFFYEELQKQKPAEPIRYFVRKTSDVSWMQPGEDLVYGELSSVDDIRAALAGVDTIYHVAPRNVLANILKAAEGLTIRRFYFVSSTGIYSKFKSSSHVDIRNEELLKKSGLVYTIIRPTMIYGNHQDGNIHLLAKLLQRYPIFPVIGDGSGLMHPIYAHCLAKCLAAVLHKEELTRFKEYNVAGKAALPYKQVLLNIARAMGKKILFLHIPYKLALAVGKLGDRFPNRIINYEKVLRIKEDKNFDYSEAANDLDFAPISFEEGIRLEVEALRKHHVIK